MGNGGVVGGGFKLDEVHIRFVEVIGRTAAGGQGEREEQHKGGEKSLFSHEKSESFLFYLIYYYTENRWILQDGIMFFLKTAGRTLQTPA